MFLAGLAAMAALLALARIHDVFPGDQWAVLELRQWRADWLNLAIAVIYMVALGSYVLPYLPVAIVVFAALRRWSDGLFLAAAGILPVAANLGLKEMSARPRPDAALALVEETGYAFPSGHAVFATAFYGALVYLLGRWGCFAQRPALLWAVRGALALFIMAVGASRVYLGAHWPSDVIGGFLFGGLCLAVLIALRQMPEARK